MLAELPELCLQSPPQLSVAVKPHQGRLFERSPFPKDGFTEVINTAIRYPVLTFEQEQLLFRYREQRITPRKGREELMSTIIGQGIYDVDVYEGMERLIDESCNAEDAIARAHQRLVIAIANKFSKGLLPDKVSEGNVALAESIKKFDPKLGNRLATFAYRRIAWKIRQLLIGNYVDLNEDGEMVAVLSLEKMSDEGINLYDRIPDDTDIEQEVIEAEDLVEEGKVIDFVRGVVSSRLSRLSERERFVLKENLLRGEGEERELSDIGRELGLSRERTRQIKKEGLAKIEKDEDIKRAALVAGFTLGSEGVGNKKATTKDRVFACLDRGIESPNFISSELGVSLSRVVYLKRAYRKEKTKD